MVRLKVFEGKQRRRLQLFQFHYGTIKRRARCRIVQRTYIFQFHYGTIKRQLLVGHRTVRVVFQFHYGTIKSIARQAIRPPV